MIAEQQTLSQFIAKHGLTCEVKIISPTVAEMENWPNGSSHYAVVIRHDKKRLTIRFHQGSGIKDEPKLADVLDCIASDSSGFENAGSFEEWAAEYGYDISDDSRLGDYKKTQKTYKAVEKQAQRLKSFLGEDVYKELLWETGRE